MRSGVDRGEGAIEKDVYLPIAGEYLVEQGDNVFFATYVAPDG